MASERPTVLLATRSSGKLRELKEIFRDFDFDVVDLGAAGVEYVDDEEMIESYATFDDNALAKGRYFYDLTGMPTIADDSGLVVDALGGGPGVFSKRFSGRDDLTGVALDQANNEKLLREIQRIEAERAARGEDPVSRSARYMCVAAYVGAPGEMIRTGVIEGKVIDQPRGNGGFGYDAYVEVPELGGTMAEAGWEIKAQLSHRGRAFRELLPSLREVGWA